MNISNVKKLSKEQGEIFSRLQIHRERIANILEEPAVKGVKKSATDKYSEHAHFIYELLQNADDTKAKNVRFILDKKGLIFAHNGEIHFSISDPNTEEEDQKIGKLGHINSIASIGNTAKKESQIGMFGFGFKAVFEYTNTPHAYDPPFSFKIERFIIPVLLGDDHPNRMDGETLFYFPFDLENKKDTAYKEINEKLKNLDNPLLFLRHLSKIEWENVEGESGFYSKKSEGKITSLLTKVNGNESEHKFLIFGRKVKDQERFEHTINIAYKYDPEGEKISSDHKFPAYCFFHTRESTELKFIVHAPFLLTDSREGIKESTWNDNLIKELAELAGDSLPEIREMGLLDVDFFNVLPIIKDDFKDSKFQPIYNAVLKKLRSGEKLLPANDGRHISANQAFLARGKDLIDLLNPKQLSRLFGKEDCQWLNSYITQDKTPELRKYLVEELKIQEITPEKFANQFTEEFIKEQDDEWVIRFYTFLKDQKTLWRKKDGNPEGHLRKKPFIRLENNTHDTPFDDSDKPRVYLPSDFSSSFPTVKKYIAENKEAKEFLKDHLKLNEPDKFDEVLKCVLPKYKGNADISDWENINDVKRIIEVLKNVPRDKKQNLIDELKNVHFLKAVNPVKQEKCFCTPHIHSIYLTKCYSDDEILETYFDGNPDIFFLDDIYKDFKKEDLLELGCLDKVRVRQRESNSYNGNITISNEHSNHKRGLDGFDPDCEIEGIEYALKNINKGRSIVIWNLLKQNYRSIAGVIESSSRRDYMYSKKEDMVSKMGKLVREAEWLPDKYGNFRKPSEILLSDLLNDFDKESIESKFLEKKLDFKKDNIYQLLSQLPEEKRRTYQFAETLSEEEIEHIEELRKNKEVSKEEIQGESLNYSKELEQTFNCPQIKEHEESHISPDAIPDPTRRREKVQEDIQNSKDIEPQPSERFKRVPPKKWKQKNCEAKAFLREQYDGKCQICNYSFTKRDGEPYFEGVYLVSMTKAAWIDRPGNVLCLCANCSTKLMYGSVEAENISEQINGFKCVKEGGTENSSIIKLKLCGEYIELIFTERHILDLQEILKSSRRFEDANYPVTN